MSNSILQETLGAWGAKRDVSVGFAEPAFSADNAAGIALLCRSRVLRGAAPLTE
jgi:tRNA A37 threonylcarbamoyltransferase TsaD